MLRELAVREPVSAAYIRPQREHADIIVSFYPAAESRAGQNDDAHLNVRLTLRGTLPQPDLAQIIEQTLSLIHI